MPTYGYRCTACAHEFEMFQKMTDPPVATCEVCGAPVKKRLYPVGISFKGSGFYVNDYSKSSSGGDSSESSSSKSTSDAKPAESPAPAADTKPAVSDAKPTAPAAPATPTTNS